MDFDGFLVQMRIAVNGVEQAAAPLWALAVPAATRDVPADAAAAPAAVESAAYSPKRTGPVLGQPG